MSSNDPGRTALLPEEAIGLVVRDIPAVRTEKTALSLCAGRALAGSLPNLIDQPPFDKSGMDGFAYRPGGGSDSGESEIYHIVGTFAAGSGEAGSLKPGECARIMTGAPVPREAVAVQRVEWTDPPFSSGGGECLRFARPETSDNIIRRGENLRRGEELLGPRLLAAQDIGILASSGYAEVEVAVRPLVGIVSTGDELCPPGAALPPGAIYDSNGPQLFAHALATGCLARSYGIVRDGEDAIFAALDRALSECDVVIVSGGVSMGDFDFVPAAFARLGVMKLFHGLAMRPGKPTYFGRKGAMSVFGMPGNPVSTFVNFEVLVRPHLMARMGLTFVPRIIRARLVSPLVRRGSDRVEFIPARLALPGDGGEMAVEKLAYHGSSMLTVLAGADCLLRMDIGIERMGAGEVVDVRLLRP